jgi:hypothetical protein
MATQKKTGRPIKNAKYTFLRLSKTEVNDIIVGLNLILDNEATMFRGTEKRIIRLRNRYKSSMSHCRNIPQPSIDAN